MFTNKQLTKAYDNAKVEYFDENSNYVFMSDTHRGDDSLSDEFTRNQNICLYALDYYYKNNFTYVEAGDGDELWEQSKFKYIRLAHRDIFKTLKKFFDEKRFILLYGNHNIYLKNASYVREHYYNYYSEYDEKEYELFHGIVPLEALVLKSKNSNQEFLVVHGHQGDLMNDQLWRIAMFMARYFWRFMHIVGFQNPSSPSKNLNKQHKIEIAYNHWIQEHKIALICGHTHRPKFPKNGELPYFNIGCGIHSRGVNCIEISNGMILAADWIVRADKDGNLQVERKVVRGPEPIEKYNFANNPDYENIKINVAKLKKDTV